MNKNRGIVWFRNDLRLHDNEALVEALEVCDEILAVYIFDDRIFKAKTSYGFPKTGANRCQFIIDSITELRHKIENELGGQLIVRSGLTEDVLFDLARRYKTKWIFCNRERTREEVVIQDAVEDGLWSIGQELRYTRGKMLLYTADLPFPITHTPEQFSTFKKEVLYIPIRQPLAVPEQLHSIALDEDVGVVPSLDFFGFVSRPTTEIKGGEEEGTLQLNRVVDAIKNNTPVEFLKLSPWISQGCLSPKTIYYTIKKIENRSNKSMIADIVIKLLRRDYFRFMGKKYGNKIFLRSGIQESQLTKDKNHEILNPWFEGKTGINLVDAAINSLVKTGFLTYPMRVLVASYFIHEMKQDWIVGAEFLESHLIDYDPCSNYGNWNRLAGVGAVKRDEVRLNMDHQSKLLDPDGKFVQQWLS